MKGNFSVSEYRKHHMGPSTLKFIWCNKSQDNLLHRCFTCNIPCFIWWSLLCKRLGPDQIFLLYYKEAPLNIIVPLFFIALFAIHKACHHDLLNPAPFFDVPDTIKRCNYQLSLTKQDLARKGLLDPLVPFDL